MTFFADWAGDVAVYASQLWNAVDDVVPFSSLLTIGIGLMFAPRMVKKIYKMFGGSL